MNTHEAKQEARRARPRATAYRKVTTWARKRYALNEEGTVTIWVGNSLCGRPMRNGKAYLVPSRYSMIEDLAAQRYLRCKPRWPGETLASAYRD